MKINCTMCEDLSYYYYKGYRDDLFIIREAIKFYFVLPAFKEDVSHLIVNICDNCLYNDFAKFGIYFEGDENSCMFQ